MSSRTLPVAIAVLLGACGTPLERRTDWELVSSRVHELTVVCGGERLVTAGECLDWGEAHATGLFQGQASRVVIFTRPPGQRCAFDVFDATGRQILSATGPCDPEEPRPN